VSGEDKFGVDSEFLGAAATDGSDFVGVDVVRRSLPEAARGFEGGDGVDSSASGAPVGGEAVGVTLDSALLEVLGEVEAFTSALTLVDVATVLGIGVVLVDDFEVVGGDDAVGLGVVELALVGGTGGGGNVIATAVLFGVRAVELVKGVEVRVAVDDLAGELALVDFAGDGAGGGRGRSRGRGRGRGRVGGRVRGRVRGRVHGRLRGGVGSRLRGRVGSRGSGDGDAVVANVRL